MAATGLGKFPVAIVSAVAVSTAFAVVVVVVTVAFATFVTVATVFLLPLL